MALLCKMVIVIVLMKEAHVNIQFLKSGLLYTLNTFSYGILWNFDSGIRNSSTFAAYFNIN